MQSIARGSILVVDDDVRVGNVIQRFLERSGHHALSTHEPEAALRLLRETAFDLVLIDLAMSRIDGLDLLRRVKRRCSRCEVVVSAPFASLGAVREALKHGALDFLVKPFSPALDLLPLITSVLTCGPAETDERPVATTEALPAGPAALIARDKVMRATLARAQELAPTGATLLLAGEPGSGKRTIAGLVHALSAQAAGPLLTIDCAALPESRFARALFGTAGGTSAGGRPEGDGLLHAAAGGTLVLDEVGELPLAVQAMLLRALQEPAPHRRLTAQRPLRRKTRLIASTSLDLAEAVRTGTLREDLYEHLNAEVLRVPPLRERPDDLIPLLERLLAQTEAPPRTRFTRAALRVLERYPWPGNVRELARTVEHAVAVRDGPELGLAELPLALQDHGRNIARAGRRSVIDAGALEEIERRCIERALRKTGNQRARAAAILGLTLRGLGHRMVKYELSSPLEGARRGAAPRMARARRRQSAGTGSPSASAR